MEIFQIKSKKVF